jgi:hypothetical protein
MVPREFLEAGDFDLSLVRARNQQRGGVETGVVGAKGVACVHRLVDNIRGLARTTVPVASVTVPTPEPRASCADSVAQATSTNASIRM